MLMDVIFFVFYNKMCQQLENLYNSVNQYFLDVTEVYRIKNPFKMQHGPMI